MTRKRFFLIALFGTLLGAAGCYVDFLDGLPCRDDGDCDGYACISGACAPLLTEGNDGGSLVDGKLSLSGIIVKYDANGDGKLSPGETATLELHVKNESSATAPGIVGIVTTSTAGVTITNGNNLLFSYIYSGESNCGTNHSDIAGRCGFSQDMPEISVAPSVTAGTPINLTLNLQDTHGNTVSLSGGLTVQ